MTRLALAALVTWARTFRFLTIVTVLVVVVTSMFLIAVWLLPIDVSIGPLQISRRGR